VIEIKDLTKTYAGSDTPAVDGIDLTVPSGSLVTLLGPSGCGKTTTLRSIAGLEKPDSGAITIGDRTVFSSDKNVNLRTNQRDLGMVFQSYAIWPHMTVFENVAYPLKRGRTKRGDIKDRVMQALSMVGLEEYAPRRAPNLSGGQQQRVALARALVGEPEVLLLDEPLSNLDAQLRESMRQEIREIQQRLGITALYVTHDQTEALAISDYVAVMSGGHIVDLGSPQRIYQAPASRFVAEFMGLANILPVDHVTLTPDGGQGGCPLGQVTFRQTDHIRNGAVTLLNRLEDVELRAPADTDPREENTWRGEVVSALFLGSTWDCIININGFRLRCWVPRSASIRAGDVVDVHIDPGDFVPLPETEAAAVAQSPTADMVEA
jgi:iron(III) transport system ATP-binding protein